MIRWRQDHGEYLIAGRGHVVHALSVLDSRDDDVLLDAGRLPAARAPKSQELHVCHGALLAKGPERFYRVGGEEGPPPVAEHRGHDAVIGSQPGQMP
jgi:hypothetical protein